MTAKGLGVHRWLNIATSVATIAAFGLVAFDFVERRPDLRGSLKDLASAEAVLSNWVTMHLGLSLASYALYLRIKGFRQERWWSDFGAGALPGAATSILLVTIVIIIDIDQLEKLTWKWLYFWMVVSISLSAVAAGLLDWNRENSK